MERCYGYASTDLAAELYRQHGHRVRFNDSPEYPQIVEILEEVEFPKPHLLRKRGRVLESRAMELIPIPRAESYDEHFLPLAARGASSDS